MDLEIIVGLLGLAGVLYSLVAKRDFPTTLAIATLGVLTSALAYLQKPFVCLNAVCLPNDAAKYLAEVALAIYALFLIFAIVRTID